MQRVHAGPPGVPPLIAIPPMPPGLGPDGAGQPFTQPDPWSIEP